MYLDDLAVAEPGLEVPADASGGGPDACGLRTYEGVETGFDDPVVDGAQRLRERSEFRAGRSVVHGVYLFQHVLRGADPVVSAPWDQRSADGRR